MQVVCRLEDIDPKSGKEVCIDDEHGSTYLMLFIQNNKLVGFQNRCPHQGRTMNWAEGRFLVSGSGQLVCPHHGASFDLASGQCIAGPCKGGKLKPVNTRVIDGDVYVDVPLESSGLRKSN